jgi:hypothetical protein
MPLWSTLQTQTVFFLQVNSRGRGSLQAKVADLLAVSRGSLSLGVRTVDAQGHPATYRRSSRPWSPAGRHYAQQ